jgi:hypothetical protein
MAHLNIIIIYLNSKEEHKEHIKWVLRKLYKENTTFFESAAKIKLSEPRPHSIEFG